MEKCNKLTPLPFKGLRPRNVCSSNPILKAYVRTKIKFLGQGFQRLEHEQDRHTDVTERITTATFVDGNKRKSDSDQARNVRTVDSFIDQPLDCFVACVKANECPF